MADFTISDRTPKIEVNIRGYDEPDGADLFDRIDEKVQPVLLEIAPEPSGESVSVDVRPDPNVGPGVSEEAWNGRVVQFEKKDPVTPGEAADFVRRNADLIERIAQGHSTNEPGTDPNRKGRLTDDAAEAVDELRSEWWGLESARVFMDADEAVEKFIGEEWPHVYNDADAEGLADAVLDEAEKAGVPLAVDLGDLDWAAKRAIERRDELKEEAEAAPAP